MVPQQSMKVVDPKTGKTLLPPHKFRKGLRPEREQSDSEQGDREEGHALKLSHDALTALLDDV